ncbi:hypothetical protein [Phytoactinopolyspora endophytica]|uniref:hypothetical protein n=1 Tax=Phytoactinopolyspora endophytica TaxID=1642495 RepID=UPI00101BB898|nr:hypothetical protein [Phytoactinopolyspora endophytica]
MPDSTATIARAATPDGGTAETKVLAALAAHPDGTVVEIAAAAGVGRSTAGKVLAAAERRGQASRTPGAHESGERTPDSWTIVSVAGKSPRLRRGALRDMVAEYLAARPGEEFGPTAIGHALNRSSGAVANALAKLVVTGQVAQTSERPARYTTARTAVHEVAGGGRAEMTTPTKAAPSRDDVAQAVEMRLARNRTGQ